MGIAARRAVGGKTAKIARVRTGKEFFSTVVRRRTMLVDIMFHKWQIRIDSQQST
jgi:hypothetical protein